VIVEHIEVAASFVGRLRGLMWRRDLPEGEALLLPGTNSIHMLFMRFPIDCLFLGRPEVDGTQRVVSVRRKLPRWRGVVWYVRRGRDVIEMPAGTLDATNIQVGDAVRLERSLTL